MAILKGRESYPFYFGASIEILSRAGELRKSMTRSEKILWQKLRNKKLNGYHFRRQHPIDTFIVDFFCYEAMLVIEVDGNVHQEPTQAEYDFERTRILNCHKIQVLRFSNYQVEKEIDTVLNIIDAELRNCQP
jgi:very-short-patch-repair endonuclease